MNKRTSSSFSWISLSLSLSLETSGRGKSTSLSSWYFSSELGGLITSAYQPNIQSVARASVELDPPLPIPVIPFHLCHFVDALGPIVFIMRLLCHILQVLHVRPHQHVPQQQGVRVKWILHWHTRRQQARMSSWIGCEYTAKK